MNINSISNSELRQELIKLGEKPGPISATTKSVYIRRLESLRKSKKSPAQPSHEEKSSKISRKAFGFSSDESDTNEENSKPNTRTRSSRKKSEVVTTPKQKETTSTKSPLLNRAVNKITRLNTDKLKVNDYSDESGNDEESVGEEYIECVNASTSPMKLQSTPLSLKSDLKRRSLLLPDTSTPIPSAVSPRNVACQNMKDVQFSTPRINLRKYLESNGSLNGSLVTQVKPDKPKPYKTLWQKFKDLIGFSDTKKKLDFNQTPSISYEYTKTSSWSLHCSKILPLVPVFFFFILGLLYLTMKADSIDETGALLEPVDSQMRVVNRIFEVLGAAAGNRLCKYTIEDRLHIDEIHELAKVSSQELQEALSLICKYPKWGIFLYKDLGSDELPPLMVTSCDQLDLVRYMSSNQVFLPAFCRFQRAFKKIFFGFFILILLAVILLAANAYRKYMKEKLIEENQQMFMLVEKIVALVQKQQQLSETEEVDKFVPILQARDILIEASERRKMDKVWKRAVDFIAENDSRIRVETQRVLGQDLEVWRWVQIVSSFNSSRNASRTWQGEAFDLKKCSNAPTVSPSSCLKIRNVFNPETERSEKWEYEIQDAILEKCSNCVDILCIVVEKKSSEGLVYVKCGSPEGAGKVFRSLHGTWFDGRLITVRFIKLKRFEEHYPQYKNVTTPLKHHFSKPVSNFSLSNTSS